MKFIALFVCALLATSGKPAFALTTFRDYGNDAYRTLKVNFYTAGLWQHCSPHICGASNVDWGADSMTYALFLAYKTTGDASAIPYFKQLERTAPAPTTAYSLSDVEEWDSIAASEDYLVTHDSLALAKAKGNYAVVQDAGAKFAAGACPTIDYQFQNGGGGGLKTLETDSNYVKAALLLYEETKSSDYLTQAVQKYAAIKQYFKDPAVALYTVYVYDDRKSCYQLPHRFYSSVNGNMIYNGVRLARDTGNQSYLRDAVETSNAVDLLSDPAGIHEDLQAENDIEEPLVEAMYLLASMGDAHAYKWILRNAGQAAAARKPDGSYGRFFGGPPPTSTVTVWQANGGLALEIAAAALNSRGLPAANRWDDAPYTAHHYTVGESLKFGGRKIALIGTVGEQCCQPGHARLFIDGNESFDRTGIWQNKSSSRKSLADSVLFAWQWDAPGSHDLGFEAGIYNVKEGGSFLDIVGFYVQ